MEKIVFARQQAVGSQTTRGRHVKSTDKRKAIITAALKQASGARKVTLVTEIGPGLFVGNCITPAGRTTPGQSFGFWEVQFEVVS